MSPKKTVIFIGSSVCKGTGATELYGWSRMLDARLTAEGWTCEHTSIGGQDTGDILLRLGRDVIDRHPDCCIVGLGLANEGLKKTQTPEEAECVRAVFDANMRKIISALQKADIAVACGGVYPNNRYNGFQYETLKKEEALSASWGVPVFSWLSALDDGQGHFREGLYHDAGHPSDEGYRVMYECIPEKIFESEK